MMDSSAFESWAILELFGHVRIAGKVTEEQRFGGTVGRIDIPGPDGAFVTQFFGSGAIYRLTPTTEEIARRVAQANAPAPIHPWELQLPAPHRTTDGDDERYDPEDDDADDPDPAPCG